MPTPPDDQNKQIVDAINTMNSNLVTVLKELSPALEETLGGVQSVRKEMLGLSGDAKKVADEIGDWADGTDKLIRVTKELSRGVKPGMSYRQLFEMMNKIKATSESALRSGFLSQKGQSTTMKGVVQMGRTIDQLERKFHKLGKSADDACDDAIFLEAQHALHGYVQSVNELSSAWKKVDLTPFTRQMRGINSLLGRHGGNIEKFAQMGQRAAEFRKFREEEKDTKRASADERRRALKAKLSAIGVDEDDPDEQREKLRHMIKNGQMDASYGRKLMREADSTKEGTLRHFGEGNLMRGATGKVADLAGGGLSNIMGMAGSFAGPLGIAAGIGGLIKDAYDKVVQMNIDIEQGLGQGGVFSGSGGSKEALKNVRNNLTPGWWDNYNITYEKQLNVAKTLAESGLNVADLAQKGGSKGFNTISQVAFGSARVTGLDEAGATKQIVKLLDQYHVSLDSTDDFFKKLQKDTRAAGISTTKYLGIIDELTSQFDEMGNSLEGITTMLRVMGRTGLQSAESMKKAMSVLMGPKERSMEDQSFIGAQYLENPEDLNKTISDLQGDVKTATEHAQNAVGRVGGLVRTDDIDWNSTAGITKIYERLAQAQKADPTNVELKNAGNTLEYLKNERLRLSAQEQLRDTGDVVAYGASRQMIPGNLSNRMNDTMMMMKFIAKQSVNPNTGKAMSVSDLMNDQSLLASSAAPLQALLQQKFGMGAQDLTNLWGTYHGGVGSLIGEATAQLKPGQHDNFTDADYAKLARLAVKGGISKSGSMSDKEFIKSLSEADKDKLREVISGQEDSFSEVMGMLKAAMARDEGNEADQKAQDLADQTRKSADIFANAFQHMFNWIADPLMDILGWITPFFRDKEKIKQETQATQAQVDEIHQRYADPVQKADEKSIKERLAALDQLDVWYRSQGSTTGLAQNADEREKLTQILKDYNSARNLSGRDKLSYDQAKTAFDADDHLRAAAVDSKKKMEQLAAQQQAEAEKQAPAAGSTAAADATSGTAQQGTGEVKVTVEGDRTTNQVGITKAGDGGATPDQTTGTSTESKTGPTGDTHIAQAVQTAIKGKK